MALPYKFNHLQAENSPESLVVSRVCYQDLSYTKAPACCPEEGFIIKHHSRLNTTAVHFLSTTLPPAWVVVRGFNNPPVVASVQVKPGLVVAKPDGETASSGFRISTTASHGPLLLLLPSRYFLFSRQCLNPLFPPKFVATPGTA